MYLSRTDTPDIFVPVKQASEILRDVLLVTIIIFGHIPILFGQQVWPGDINNNGIVNNIDVLYWAVAKDATGASRPGSSTNWEGQNLPATLWGQSFPNGLNYAYADANGNGRVDDADKEVIDRNFGQVHGQIVPDDYATGNPATDPVLLLTTDEPVVPPGETLLADLSLGSSTDQITDFYGIAFTLRYDPDAVSNQGNAVRLDILADSWMNGQGNEKVIQMVKNDRDLGIAQIAIVRKDGQAVSGFGEIGTISIVMEDIVLGRSKATVTDIKLVDRKLADAPVAPSELDFWLDTERTTPATDRPITRSGIRMYPNPAAGQQITLELENEQEKIRLVQLFDAQGRLLMQRSFVGQVGSQALSVAGYANGVYIVKVYTDKGLYVRSFNRNE